MTTRRLDDPADRPTQRLDASSDEADERPCLRCGEPMRRVTVTTTAGGSIVGPSRVRLNNMIGSNLLGLQRVRQTDCYAWVCPACNYTELVAEDAAGLFTSEP